MRLSGTLALAAAIALVGAAPAAAQDPTDPLYPAIGPAGGLTFNINPAVPPGYDSARFVSVVRRSLARWGDVDGGLTDAAPGDGTDGVHVIGFASPPEIAFPGALGIYRTGVSVTQEVRPSGQRCLTVHRRVPVTKTVREARRVRVRVPLRRRGKIVRRNGKIVYQVLKRRGKVVRRNGKPVYKKRTVIRYRNVDRVSYEMQPVETCEELTSLQDVEHFDYAVLLDSDVKWAFGPAHPQWTEDGTETDLESVVLHELGHVSGLGHSSEECDAATPMAIRRYSGDWWRSPTDVSVAECLLQNAP